MLLSVLLEAGDFNSGFLHTSSSHTSVILTTTQERDGRLLPLPPLISQSVLLVGLRLGSVSTAGSGLPSQFVETLLMMRLLTACRVRLLFSLGF